jgi:hypothetical protein
MIGFTTPDLLTLLLLAESVVLRAVRWLVGGVGRIRACIGARGRVM